jgi:7,8-dihydropterin-6-yl-methyl-4-(beta-D-ribofuranosyl)aminobenzene 5'-phosphate synthase
MFQSYLTKITILCDDRLSPPLFSEHGFSVLIEREGEVFLFDTGTSDVFIRNANILGKDLSKIENIIISHGHYDHAGGLKYLLPFNKKYKVILREEAFLPKYSNDRFTGIDWEILRKSFDFLIVKDKVLEISKSIYVFGPAPFKNDFEEPDPNFFVLKVDKKERDFFEEELNLVIDEEDGLILITGCAHRGIVNIVNYAVEKFNKRIKTLMGGFHLYKSDPLKIEKVINNLGRFDIENIISYHCTGDLAIKIIKEKKSYG